MAPDAAARAEAGDQVGEVVVWNGETTAYVRLVAREGWEFTEVRVGGALRPAQGEVVIEAMHLNNPYAVQPGDEVLLAVFARLRPVGGGQAVEAWAEGTPSQPGQHPMYFRYTLQECPVLERSTITAGEEHSCGSRGAAPPTAGAGTIGARWATARPLPASPPPRSPAGASWRDAERRDGGRTCRLIHSRRMAMVPGSAVKRSTCDGRRRTEPSIAFQAQCWCPAPC
jgi:hypothetical protein